MCLTGIRANHVPAQDEGNFGTSDPQLWVYEGQGNFDTVQKTASVLDDLNPTWGGRVCVSTRPRQDRRTCFDIRDDYPWGDGDLLAFGCTTLTPEDATTHRTITVHLDSGTTISFMLELPLPSSCLTPCQRNVLPSLPLLTVASATIQPEWEAYARRVYHQSLGSLADGATLDPNTFSIFYRDSGGQSLVFADDPCLEVCTLESWPDREAVYDGTPWVGDSGPEKGIGEIGFFVHRPFILRQAAQACDVLEVMHVRTEWLGGEKGVSWFFHAPGSGIFLHCHELPTEGQIVVYRNRADWQEAHGGRSWVMDEHILGTLEEEGVAMLIFTAADFTVFDSDGTNPSTEIVVRHKNRRSNELDSGRGSCLDDPRIGFQFRTGFDASLPCVCRPRDPPRAAINCDDTPLQ